MSANSEQRMTLGVAASVLLLLDANSRNPFVTKTYSIIIIININKDIFNFQILFVFQLLLFLNLNGGRGGEILKNDDKKSVLCTNSMTKFLIAFLGIIALE